MRTTRAFATVCSTINKSKPDPKPLKVKTTQKEGAAALARSTFETKNG